MPTANLILNLSHQLFNSDRCSIYLIFGIFFKPTIYTTSACTTICYIWLQNYIKTHTFTLHLAWQPCNFVHMCNALHLIYISVEAKMIMTLPGSRNDFFLHHPFFRRFALMNWLLFSMKVWRKLSTNILESLIRLLAYLALRLQSYK